MALIINSSLCKFACHSSQLTWLEDLDRSMVTEVDSHGLIIITNS